jgi:hypothetical protein
VPAEFLQQVKADVLAEEPTDYYTRWAKWFLADRRH